MLDLGAIIFVATPFLLISLGMFVSNILLTLRSEKTTGKVVGHQSKTGKNGHTHAEVVEFHEPDGKPVQFTEKLYRSTFVMNPGRTVNVLYDPKDVTQARINSFLTLYAYPTIFLGIGLAAIAFSLPQNDGLLEKILNFVNSLLDKFSWLL